MRATKFFVLLVCLALIANFAWGQSKNVVIIGGTTLDNLSGGCGQSYVYTDANVMNATGGGCLNLQNISGLTGFEAFTFAPLAPGNVSTATLTGFDTAVLNVASSAMACNTNNLSAQAKADLIAFVGTGKKLIIFDSECQPVDYSWLPYAFSTANPGAMGAPGTLTIVEENTLSTNDATKPAYINAADLSSNTDAVGDMNVMTTYNPNWCLDMSGTNYLNVTGPVHTYAKFPPDADAGLIIYNGLDQDYQYYYVNNANLTKIWLLELQQPFNPSILPCGYTVVGITLDPPSAENPAGTAHTVTATLMDLLKNPKPGIVVSLNITAGPNAGTTAYTCSPNADCSTDATGVVSMTYTGAMAIGTDTIKACFTDTAGHEICSQPVTKVWKDATPPEISCGNGGVLWPPNHKLWTITVPVTAADPESGVTSVILLSATSNEPDNGLGDGDTANDIQGFQVNTNDMEGLLRAERSGKGTGRIYTLTYQATNGANLTSTCTATYVVPHDQM